MTEWRNTGSERVQERWRPNRRPADRASGAEELKRIVRVAEELRVDPHVVRIALEDEDGTVRTDIALRDSIRIVERELKREERVPYAVGRQL